MGHRPTVTYPLGVCATVPVMPPATQVVPTRGYTATKDQLQARLRRIEGQVRGVERMVDEERYCIDVAAVGRLVRRV